MLALSPRLLSLLLSGIPAWLILKNKPWVSPAELAGRRLVSWVHLLRATALAAAAVCQCWEGPGSWLLLQAVCLRAEEP